MANNRLDVTTLKGFGYGNLRVTWLKGVLDPSIYL